MPAAQFVFNVQVVGVLKFAIQYPTPLSATCQFAPHLFIQSVGSKAGVFAFPTKPGSQVVAWGGGTLGVVTQVLFRHVAPVPQLATAVPNELIPTAPLLQILPTFGFDDADGLYAKSVFPLESTAVSLMTTLLDPDLCDVVEDIVVPALGPLVYTIIVVV